MRALVKKIFGTDPEPAGTVKDEINAKARLIEDSDLSLSIYKDNTSGEIFVKIVDKKNPTAFQMISAEAVFRAADTVNVAFHQNVNAFSTQALN